MSEHRPGAARTRRELLRDAGVAAAGTAALSVPGASSALARRKRRRPTVAIFGGGIAGLTAAHELAERGFRVTVYERRAWGGKARSTEVPHSARSDRDPLPGEHGWRAWIGFYRNTKETMRRIPFNGNRNGVLDNLVAAPQHLIARDGGRANLVLPFGVPDPNGLTPQAVIDLVTGAALQLKLPPAAVAHLGKSVGIFFSSCDARRLGQWENTTAADFLGSDRFGDDYRKVIVNTFTESIQASKAENTSAAFSAHYLELAVYNLLGLASDGDPNLFRFMDAPTNEALFDPWLRELQRLGVTLRLGHEVTRLEMERGQVSEAVVLHGNGKRRVDADWYLSALPVERARRLWTKPILQRDRRLRKMNKLDTAWMNGVKFFLRRPLPLTRGILYCVDSPWLITAVSQSQFWGGEFGARYGNGQAHESLSAIVASWTAPGILYRKPARDCTPRQVVNEIWAQMKAHLNDSGEAVLTDDLLHSWEIDPGMLRRDHRLVSGDPLVLPTVGQRRFRPGVTTGIRNLFLAGDYLDCDWEVANMEAASYNGKRAANTLMAAAGSRESPATVLEPYRPPEWEPLKKIDEDRYRRGLPNMLDVG